MFDEDKFENLDESPRHALERSIVKVFKDLYPEEQETVIHTRQRGESMKLELKSHLS